MKLKKAQKSEVSKPSLVFSFEADPLLNLSLEEVESLPVGLQNELRNLQEEEDSLIESNELYTRLVQHVTKIDRNWRAAAKIRDGIRRGVLELREICLGVEEESVEEIRNMLLHMNSEFMTFQESIINLSAGVDEIAKKRITVFEEASRRKANHLSRKEEFMKQVVVREQHAKD